MVPGTQLELNYVIILYYVFLLNIHCCIFQFFNYNRDNCQKLFLMLQLQTLDQMLKSLFLLSFNKSPFLGNRGTLWLLSKRAAFNVGSPTQGGPRDSYRVSKVKTRFIIVLRQIFLFYCVLTFRLMVPEQWQVNC